MDQNNAEHPVRQMYAGSSAGAVSNPGCERPTQRAQRPGRPHANGPLSCIVSSKQTRDPWGEGQESDLAGYSSRASLSCRNRFVERSPLYRHSQGYPTNEKSPQPDLVLRARNACMFGLKGLQPLRRSKIAHGPESCRNCPYAGHQ